MPETSKRLDRFYFICSLVCASVFFCLFFSFYSPGPSGVVALASVLGRVACVASTIPRTCALCRASRMCNVYACTSEIER